MKIVRFILSLLSVFSAFICFAEKDYGQSCKSVTQEIEKNLYWLETVNTSVLEDGSLAIIKTNPIQDKMIIFTPSVYSLEQCQTSDGIIWNILRVNIPRHNPKSKTPELQTL